ncbi:hypothetical protein AAF712_013089 [Marasmius tenuissimus]|uniref:Uncharacterized protein n=1 Tax=Marasmius tenuissimus TaxID=585030 RepID=A0ABR2ZI45_9AGAR
MSAQPTELDLVAIFANNAILTSAGLLTTSVLYGVYMVLFFSAMTILCNRREGIVSARLVLIAAVVVLFLFSTAYLCCTMSYFMLGLRHLLIKDVGVPLLKKNAAFIAKYRIVGVVGQVLLPIAVVIGDSIVVWRAWALSAGNKKIMFLPVLLQLALTATSFAWVGCFVDAGMPTMIPETCKKINTATYILSMLTNIAGTSVIGYTTWCYRKAISKYLNNCRHQARAEKVMVLLVESGVLYTSLWIIQLAVLVAPSNSSFVNQAFRQIFSAAATQLVGIYPTAIIVLVFLQRSLWDTTGVPSVCLTESTAPTQSETQATLEAASNESLHREKPEPTPLPVLFIQDKQDKKDGDDLSEGGSSPYSPYSPRVL